jgi:predicted TPR repeat methyltransferase
MLADALSPSPEAPPSSLPQLQDTPKVVLKRQVTTVFYEAVAAGLESEQIVWDFGCGNGLGSSLLRAEGRQVIGIDRDPPATPSSEHETTNLRFCRDATSAAKFGPPDVIIIADVLGYLDTPRQTLLELATFSHATTQLLVFEPRADITQQLPLHKHRAYSPVELVEHTSMGGFTNQALHETCQTWSALSAQRAPSAAVEALSQGQPATLLDAALLSAATYVSAANRAIRDKDGERATRLLLNALELAPSNTQALCSLARLAQRSKSPHDALHLLRQSLALDPTNLEAMQLWLEVVAENSPQDLLTTCQALANLAPTDLEVLTLLAQLHAAGGNVDLAIQDLELIRKQQPAQSADLSITLAWLLHSAGRTADAQVEARLASLLAPDNPDVAELLGALAA